MNLINETLRIVRTQKKIYMKECKIAVKEKDMQKLYTLTKKINELDIEEAKLLEELNRCEI